MSVSKRSYRLFRPSYRDERGDRRECRKLYLCFRDHLRIRHRWPLHCADEEAASYIADRIVRFAECLRAGMIPDGELLKWQDGLPKDLRHRMAAAGLSVAPVSLQSIPGITRIHYPAGPGIYFLAKEGKIVYVGKSDGDTLLRLARHRLDKDFDEIFFLSVTLTDLAWSELYYIARYRPHYNRQHNHGNLPETELPRPRSVDQATVTHAGEIAE